MTTKPDRTRRPGVGTFDAGGGAAQWCRDVVRVTRHVHRVDAGLQAVCAAAPQRPRVASGPLLGNTLAQVVERPDTAEPARDDAAQARRRRRRETNARNLAGRVPADGPDGERARPRRFEAAEPTPPRGRKPRPATCPPDLLSAEPSWPSSAPPRPDPPATTARPRGLVGTEPDTRVPGLTRSPASRHGARPGPRAGSARPGQPTVAHLDLAATLAARLATRVGARAPENFAWLSRAPVRATGPSADLTATDLRMLAAGPAGSATASSAERTASSPDSGDSAGSAGARHPTGSHRPRDRAVDSPDERRRMGAGTGHEVGSAHASRARQAHGEVPPGLGATPAPTHPEPPADVQGLRALTRYAEPPAQPPRLGRGPLTDDTRAARGLPWTGTAEVTPDVRAATTAVGLSEPDLELVMTRILDDAARRHGIEV